MNLPEFIKLLEKNKLLKKVSVPVGSDLEITEIISQLYQKHEKNLSEIPALLFEQVGDSAFPLLVNLLGSEKSVELLLGDLPENVGREAADKIKSFKKAVSERKIFSWAWKERSWILKAKSFRTVRSQSAPFKEVRKFRGEIDLTQFPITKSWPLDGGKFITAGLVITQSPKNRTRNMGIYRLQLLNKKELLVHWQIQKGGGFHYFEAEELGQPLEIAVVIGSDPLLWLCGMAPLPEKMDELNFAGYLSGKPVSVVPCETVGLEVPSSAEIVIEGIVRPGRRQMEGPFGDHFGHYSHPAPYPVIEVQCITHKKNPVYHCAVVGKPPQEDKAMGEAVTEIFTPLLKLAHPEIESVWSYYETGFHNLLVVSVNPRYEKEGIKSALSLLGQGQLSLTKTVILTNASVNIRDFSSVLKAIRDHFEPQEDFILLPGTAQDSLDFTGAKPNLGSKMIINAIGKDIPRPWVLTPVEKLIHEFQKEDSRILDIKIFEETLLAVQAKKEGREVLQSLLKKKELAGFKMIAVVSPDVPLDNQTLLLWGIFTRFDCERDILFASSRLDGIKPVYHGPMGIDATWKKNYPEPVEMDPQIVEGVQRKWKDYGL